MAEPDKRWDFNNLLQSTALGVSSYALKSRPVNEKGWTFGLPLPIRVDVVTTTKWWDSERKMRKAAEKRRFIGFAALLRESAVFLEYEAQKLQEKASKLRLLAAKFDHCEEIRQLEARRR